VHCDHSYEFSHVVYELLVLVYAVCYCVYVVTTLEDRVQVLLTRLKRLEILLLGARILCKTVLLFLHDILLDNGFFDSSDIIEFILAPVEEINIGVLQIVYCVSQSQLEIFRFFR